MKKSFKALATLATAALAGGVLTLAAPAASAAVTVPWEPDALSLGSLTLFDATGNPITTGSTTSSPFVAYAVASGTTPDTGINKVGILQVATPDGTVSTEAYAKDSLGSATPYPVATDPASVRASGNPYASSVSGDFSLADYIGLHPNNLTGAYAGLYQVRVYTPSTTATGLGKYFSVDIQVTGTTWTVVYPAAKVAATITAITPSVASPADHGSSVTLSATVGAADATHPAGTVEWFDNAVSLGAGTFAAATGAASITLTPVDGPHSYTATFTPTDLTTYAGAVTSAALSYTVNAVGTTSVSLSVNPISGPAVSTTLTATVTPTPAGTPAGSVQFFDGAAAIGAGTPSGANVYTLTKAAGFSGGVAHDFTAVFTPTNANAWGTAKTSNHIAATYDAPACTSCTDAQTAQVTVDAGTLIISTPYTPTNPFDLGHMVLSADGTHLSASAPFGAVGTGSQGAVTTLGAAAGAGTSSLTVADGTGVAVGQLVQIAGFPVGAPAVANGTRVATVSGTTVTLTGVTLAAVPSGTSISFLGNGGVTITDTRAGDQSWTASVYADNFTHGSDVINAQNLSFTGVTPLQVGTNALGTAAKPVVPQNVTSAAGSGAFISGYGPLATGNDGLAVNTDGSGHTFATAVLGAGSVYVDGVLTLIAPTTTKAGLYTTTVTFTIA
jgi:hypothetical protein